MLKKIVRVRYKNTRDDSTAKIELGKKYRVERFVREMIEIDRKIQGAQKSREELEPAKLPDAIFDRAAKLRVRYSQNLINEDPSSPHVHKREDVERFFSEKRDRAMRISVGVGALEIALSTLMGRLKGWNLELSVGLGMLAAVITFATPQFWLASRQDKAERAWEKVKELSNQRRLVQKPIKAIWVFEELETAVGAQTDAERQKLRGILTELHSLDARHLKTKFTMGGRRYAAVVEDEKVNLYYKGLKEKSDGKKKKDEARAPLQFLIRMDGAVPDYFSRASTDADLGGTGWLRGCC